MVERPTHAPKRKAPFRCAHFRTVSTGSRWNFDDDHAVANAGLIGPATLSEHLGLRELFDSYVDLEMLPAGRTSVSRR